MDITQILRGESSKDCECCAWAQFECACGAQWPESVAREAADELDRLRAELAELAELRARVASGDYDYTVDEICNAYESGVGHRGRPTASVNPYRKGSDLATAYNIGALGDRESPAAAAVPEDVAKDAGVSDVVLLKAYTTETNEVLPHSWRPIYLKYARIGIRAAILAAKENKP